MRIQFLFVSISVAMFAPRHPPTKKKHNNNYAPPLNYFPIAMLLVIISGYIFTVVAHIPHTRKQYGNILICSAYTSKCHVHSVGSIHLQHVRVVQCVLDARHLQPQCSLFQYVNSAVAQMGCLNHERTVI
jgi:hypothetical protein